ncbi:hypothetical protein [Streptomyces sp. x-80]|uniref:hypothetical protein n=1 Tax=Streptomyces sp. x-80 TaxID=2789282 RepID=UPI003980CB09
MPDLPAGLPRARTGGARRPPDGPARIARGPPRRMPDAVPDAVPERGADGPVRPARRLDDEPPQQPAVEPADGAGDVSGSPPAKSARGPGLPGDDGHHGHQRPAGSSTYR